MKTLNHTYNFKTALKVLPTEGNLVWEYNPFFNYRLDHDMIFYKNRLMEYEEFAKEVELSIPENIDEYEDKNKCYLDYISTIENWDDIIPKSETQPIPYQKGQLVDFETNELSFDLNNPVNILPQWSYDNSVNLIINDGKNPPRLINSRFSATERNKYQVCNRKGNNDTNIYDLGELFDIDTSLYKKINTIPELKFLGVNYGGNLSIGNYHFYFKYVDDDGNESDFFAESGLVSIFIGNTADSIHSGFRDENSHKSVKFLLKNTDSGYHKVAIYYTRATSDIFENAVINAYRINEPFVLSDTLNTIINISGFESVEQVTVDDINTKYQIYGSAETQETAQNILFLGNVDKPKLDYLDLADCALRFLPELDIEELYNVNQLGINYSGSIKNTYYDPNYIYNKVGYWDDEIYRLGIVFIKQDNTLTEVFNVRGGLLNTNIPSYSEVTFLKDNTRHYVNYDEYNYRIIPVNDNKEKPEPVNLENARGVIHIQAPEFKNVIGIRFKVKKEVIDYLTTHLKIKGYFFVRQKRIPTTLCQAYTIGIDKESHTPVLPGNFKLEKSELKYPYITESFLTYHYRLPLYLGNSLTNIVSYKTYGRELDNDVDKRLRGLHLLLVKNQGAICPEYDVNSPYLNSLFSASELVIRNCIDKQNLKRDENHFYPENFNFTKSDSYTNVKIIGVEDNTKLVAINDDLFSARAGEAEEAFRFEYIGLKNKNTEADNLLRGSFGPYLGITGYEEAGHLVDIKIPGYNPALLEDYFRIRYEDSSAFYAISDRYIFSKIENQFKLKDDEYSLINPLYRGDCYICQFTHRLNRNFLDPTAPTNDDIIDPKCWKDHFKVKDEIVLVEKFDKINLGDVNAVLLGLYVTLVVRSTMNLNIRALDDSIPDEEAMFGHPRGFYPYSPMTTKGSYKIPEALCYNKGFEKSVSERYNFEVPDVPWIKNEYSNRIAYSNILVQDAFQNGWRTFLGGNYMDYSKTYGSITKLVELNGNLVCIFEHGVGLIPVNERVASGEGDGGAVYINTPKVLPINPKILSDTFGSQWRESVIKTPKGIYGVDTIGRKIWYTDGTNFKCISDFKVQEFLNNNISLTERELEPIIGIRNVKSHYNNFKGDIMFTFYDNLYGFEEKVWNLCYNERIDKWSTFYSWIPSYSENIYNSLFSFDRNTSKWIAKLGISKHNGGFSDGVTLSNNIIPNDSKPGRCIGRLYLDNRNIPKNATISYELIRDNFGNWENFKIDNSFEDPDTGEKYPALCLKTTATNLCSELFIHKNNDKELINPDNKFNDFYTTYNNEDHIIWDDVLYIKTIAADKKDGELVYIADGMSKYSEWLNNCVLESNYKISKDENGIRKTLDLYNRINGNKIVILLNIRAKITIPNEEIPEISEVYSNTEKIDSGYYESVVAVIPEYNMLFLTTDFWRHGLAGIIDISDKILPTHWYGKQHPFEFEFIVTDNIDVHKIFDNLEIISNKAAPESFHYEIVGECYDFAKDKKNMYIRLEATKHLYQYNKSDITYDSNYLNLEECLRPLQDSKGNIIEGCYDKSTLLPLYYSRQDSINEIEDYYHLKEEKSKDFSALAGGEIVHYPKLNEYRLWNHAKAIDLNESGRLRGNMQYKEDKWYVLINPLNIIQCNEEKWENGKIPVELNQNPLPDDILINDNSINIPENFDKGYVTWNWEDSDNKEVKLKDKYIKIRIRYKGDDLAIISAINTLYSISKS